MTMETHLKSPENVSGIGVFVSVMVLMSVHRQQLLGFVAQARDCLGEYLVIVLDWSGQLAEARVVRVAGLVGRWSILDRQVVRHHRHQLASLLQLQEEHLQAQVRRPVDARVEVRRREGVL